MTSAPAVGPISAAVVDRPPFGPMEHLPHDRLVAEQRTSAESPRRRYSLSARALFAVMDKLYGAPRTLEKFRVLELVARVPYQAWENVAYVAVTHTARQHGFARRVFDRVRTARWEQDNEQWHLLILEELSRDAPRSGFVRSRVIPQILAFVYYQLSWFMFVIRPAWSYRLNADFEDHAEHEYAFLVDEHPEWEGLPYDSQFASDFGEYDSLADLFRQIGYDERLHKQESEVRMGDPRFT
jgi:ubiquinol oxidase